MRMRVNGKLVDFAAKPEKTTKTVSTRGSSRGYSVVTTLGHKLQSLPDRQDEPEESEAEAMAREAYNQKWKAEQERLAREDAELPARLTKETDALRDDDGQLPDVIASEEDDDS